MCKGKLAIIAYIYIYIYIYARYTKGKYTQLYAHRTFVSGETGFTDPGPPAVWQLPPRAVRVLPGPAHGPRLGPAVAAYFGGKVRCAASGPASGRGSDGALSRGRTGRFIFSLPISFLALKPACGDFVATRMRASSGAPHNLKAPAAAARPRAVVGLVADVLPGCPQGARPSKRPAGARCGAPTQAR